MVRNAKQIWLWIIKQFLLIKYCVIYEWTNELSQKTNLVHVKRLNQHSLHRLYRL